MKFVILPFVAIFILFSAFQLNAGKRACCLQGCECIQGDTPPQECVNCRNKCNKLPLDTESIPAKYIVLSVLYAPPGTAVKGKQNTASYSNTSNIGISTTTDSSYKKGISVSASASGGLFSGGGSFSATKIDDKKDQIILNQSNTNIATVLGPSRDTIDHDSDQVILWCRGAPKVCRVWALLERSKCATS